MDVALLRQAVELARANGAEGQLPFGAVIANGDDVVATGVNTSLADNDPTAHGEVVAVRAACRELGTITLAGTTLYTSCEPCPICHTVAIAAEIDRIVYAAPKEWVPDLGTPFAPVLFDIQAAARQLDPGRIEQVELPEAREPFTAFLESQR
ncbi:guanine deaminase [Kribbella steppae]|uniref:Guanine deaminase n=1 Tax=Kribbella steppae TaxID=2512223 RepID=A0A4R2HD31_9ACTN|nr:nucleoside deaminase [Kribbella steppae]TCO26200.1 guanine deaminase [Kribbella steppae]